MRSLSENCNITSSSIVIKPLLFLCLLICLSGLPYSLFIEKIKRFYWDLIDDYNINCYRAFMVLINFAPCEICQGFNATVLFHLLVFYPVNVKL